MSYEREHLAQALDLLEQAIDREPRYGPALALAAAYRANVDNYDWADSRDEEENRRAAVDLAREALRAAADDPGVLGRAAMVLGRFGEDIDAALALIDRALVLNPSFAYGWYWSGWLHLFAGQAELAIEHFETSMRLNPRGQRGFHLAGCSFRQSSVRGCLGGAAHLPRRGSCVLSRISRAGSLPLRAYGPPRRSAMHPQAADSTHPGRCGDCEPIPPSGGWRAISFGLAPGGRRGEMSQTRRLAAILSADAAGYSLPMGTTGKARSNCSKHRQPLDPQVAWSCQNHRRQRASPAKAVTPATSIDQGRATPQPARQE